MFPVYATLQYFMIYECLAMDNGLAKLAESALTDCTPFLTFIIKIIIGKSFLKYVDLVNQKYRSNKGVLCGYRIFNKVIIQPIYEPTYTCVSSVKTGHAC